MKRFGANWLKASVAVKLQACARHGEFNGAMNSWGATYLEHCKAFHAPTGTVIIFTRDSGHHTSGWFKNPDFERSLHLSLSFREPFGISVQREYDAQLADEWVELFFGDARRLAWQETPKTQAGKYLDVMHWRVFADEHWQPIHPRGEVYSTELTENGWRSWSELHPGASEPSVLHAG
jgi:hypothetical protein